MRKLYLCEHSPIRNQWYKIRFEDIPYCIGMHFARHKIGVEHFFSTQRSDRTGIDRSERKQTDPVLYEMVANAQAIITSPLLKELAKALYAIGRLSVPRLPGF